jgi:recombinational DNA repair protein RecT
MAGRTREQLEERSAERKALAGTLLPAGAAELEQDRRSLSAKAEVLDELFEMFKPAIGEAMPSMIDPGSFMRTVLTGMRTSKQAVQLMQSSRPSLLAALLEAARLGLTPFTDEAAIVPYWSKADRQYIATFIPMYKGYITLWNRTGKVAGIGLNLIHQRDKWDLSYGDGGRFSHTPLLVGPDGQDIHRGEHPACSACRAVIRNADRDHRDGCDRAGEAGDDINIPIVAYCYVTFFGGGRTEVTTVTRGQAMDIRDQYSQAYAQAEKAWADSGGKWGRDSFWHTNFDAGMRKTAARQHAGVAKLSPELERLEAIDRRDDTRPEVRDRAAPVETPPMRKGIDWDKTVGGTDPGAVPEPQDGTGSQGDAGQGDAGQGGQRERAAVTRKQAPPANGQAGASVKTRARLRGRFTRTDPSLAGDEHAQFRLVVIGMLVAGQYRHLDDDAKLTEAEARYAVEQFDALQERADRASQDLGEALRAVYDRAIEQRDAALAETRAEHGQDDGGQDDGGGDGGGAAGAGDDAGAAAEAAGQ